MAQERRSVFKNAPLGAPHPHTYKFKPEKGIYYGVGGENDNPKTNRAADARHGLGFFEDITNKIEEPLYSKKTFDGPLDCYLSHGETVVCDKCLVVYHQWYPGIPFFCCPAKDCSVEFTNVKDRNDHAYWSHAYCWQCHEEFMDIRMLERVRQSSERATLFLSAKLTSY